jgi:hypothetical protein
VHRLIDFAELSPLPTPSVCGQLCGRAKARRKARRIGIPNGNAISLPRAGHPAKIALPNSSRVATTTSAVRKPVPTLADNHKE